MLSQTHTGRPSCAAPVILDQTFYPIILINLHFLDRFLRNLHISGCMKIISVAAELCYVDRQTDTTKLIVVLFDFFFSFTKAHKNGSIYVSLKFTFGVSTQNFTSFISRNRQPATEAALTLGMNCGEQSDQTHIDFAGSFLFSTPHLFRTPSVPTKKQRKAVQFSVDQFGECS